MDVVAWDRLGSKYEVDTEFKRLALEEILSTSDIVSIHLRLSQESTGLFNKERFNMMKKGAILINTARGAIIDESALIEALLSGHLSAAGLDVYTVEPLPINSKLRSIDNIVTTPHIGWTVEEVFEEFAQIACTQLIQFLSNELPNNEILL